MTDLSVAITGFVAGDNLEVRRAVQELPAALADAWLTVKHHRLQPDAAAVLQKHITATDVPGTGQIVTAGGDGIDGDLRFDLTGIDTETLGTRSYVYDIQVKLEDGTIYTIELGTVQLTGGVTETTS